MDWKSIAEGRVVRAREATRQAKEGLRERTGSSQRRYENALRELAAAERFLERVTRDGPLPVGAGQGVFG